MQNDCRVILGALLLMLCILTTSFGQASTEIEYGKISELIPLHKVYINVTDLKAYENINKEFSKYSGLEVVSKKDDAEFLLTFEGRLDRYLYSAALLGSMVVSVPGSKPNSIRVLWHSEKSTTTRFGKHPEVKSAQDFIRDLKKIRGEK